MKTSNRTKHRKERDIKGVYFELTGDMMRRLKAKTIENGTTVSRTLRSFVVGYLDGKQ